MDGARADRTSKIDRGPGATGHCAYAPGCLEQGLELGAFARVGIATAVGVDVDTLAEWPCQEAIEHRGGRITLTTYAGLVETDRANLRADLEAALS